MDNLFEDYMAARCMIKNLKRTIDEFKSGERYLKLQSDHHRVVAGYIKEIGRLRLEVGRLNAHMISTRDMWTKEYYELYDEKQAEIGHLKETIRRLEDRNWENEREHDEKVMKLTMDYDEKIYEKDCIISELKNKLAHAEALLGHDSTNTSMPTSQTPADNHALIKTYIETCRRNGINEIEALQRLCKGDPYTVQEIFPGFP